MNLSLNQAQDHQRLFQTSTQARDGSVERQSQAHFNSAQWHPDAS